MPEQPPLPPVQPSENQALPPAEHQEQVFDFNALKTHYIGKKRLGVLTALEEVELGTMIQAREQAKGLLAQAETMYIALDPGEHEQCLADIKTGSLAADIFARANEGMIRKIAYAVYQQYSQEMPRLEMKELRQQTRFILSRSIAKFDPAWGVKFSSFAQQYIYLKMLGWARDNGRLIRVSRSMEDKAAQFHALTMQGRTEEEAAELVGLTVDGIREAEAAAKKFHDAISYDTSYTGNDDDPPLIETVESPRDEIPHDEPKSGGYQGSASRKL